MSGSHSPASVWKEIISDTLRGDALDYTAVRVGLSHGGIFNMRHKFLLALQDMVTRDPVVLKQVPELDETFVLDASKASGFQKKYSALPVNMGQRHKTRVLQ